MWNRCPCPGASHRPLGCSHSSLSHRAARLHQGSPVARWKVSQLLIKLLLALLLVKTPFCCLSAGNCALVKAIQEISPHSVWRMGRAWLLVDLAFHPYTLPPILWPAALTLMMCVIHMYDRNSSSSNCIQAHVLIVFILLFRHSGLSQPECLKT